MWPALVVWELDFLGNAAKGREKPMSTFGHDEPDLCGCGQKLGHALPCLMQAGPLMIRHQIDGYEVLLPVGAKIHPRKWKPDDAVDPSEPLGGTY